MTIAQNRAYVKRRKRQSQVMRNGFFSHPLKAISYPLKGRGFPVFFLLKTNLLLRKQFGGQEPNLFVKRHRTPEAIRRTGIF